MRVARPSRRDILKGSAAALGSAAAGTNLVRNTRRRVFASRTPPVGARGKGVLQASENLAHFDTHAAQQSNSAVQRNFVSTTFCNALGVLPDI